MKKLILALSIVVELASITCGTAKADMVSLANY